MRNLLRDFKNLSKAPSCSDTVKNQPTTIYLLCIRKSNDFLIHILVKVYYLFACTLIWRQFSIRKNWQNRSLCICKLRILIIKPSFRFISLCHNLWLKKSKIQLRKKNLLIFLETGTSKNKSSRPAARIMNR